MKLTLSSSNFPSASSSDHGALEEAVAEILHRDYQGNIYATLAYYQRILADNSSKAQWPEINAKLQVLFMCGEAVPLNGPMVGIPVSIRDSDYLQEAAQLFGKKRSTLASLEVMATAWNASFADTGLWMGKTFEPVTKQTVKERCDNDPDVMAAYDPSVSRIGRNFFREPNDPNCLQSLGIPALEPLWRLKPRPMTTDASGFDGALLESNLEKERAIPYNMTGGVYLAAMGKSVVPEMLGKPVYQLNYRWPNLNPVFPMTKLVDEIVQIAEGVYLGQLVYASKNFSLGSIDLPFIPGEKDIELGVPYAPNKRSFFDLIRSMFGRRRKSHHPDYGYQNNGYFLMMDPAYAKQIYADEAFPQLRPQQGEMGYKELGYDLIERSAHQTKSVDWLSGWRDNEARNKKFTTLITGASTRSDDGDVHQMLQPGESVLQMLQRISNDISAQTQHEDHLKHFEQLHRLFRSGIAPTIQNSLFQSSTGRGYNIRVDGKQVYDWYGEEERTEGFDYYHGATLNLHWGFSETFCPDREAGDESGSLLPSVLANTLSGDALRGPNVMNMMWHNIGKYIFPWAGKSFEKISPRKLSMLLDESADLKERYPQRVRELKRHLASAPHYAAVKKNRQNYWNKPGRYAEHLNNSWDNGMSEQDKAFWTKEADERWVMGYNVQDKRIVSFDPLMKIADMNYRIPEPTIQEASEASGSPFARQGYCFLGAADQPSILPTNSGDNGHKQVFQFHYRFPMVGGPAPIGFCLDELVEIADGLMLGQLIYSTALDMPFHSAVDPAEYQYQLFGYFLLLDDEWEQHRQAIKLDTIN